MCDQGLICGLPGIGEMASLCQQVHGARNLAIVCDHGQVHARPKAQRCDQGMIKEIPDKFGRGVGNESLPPRDNMVIPTVTGDRFGACGGILNGMRGKGTAGKTSGCVQHGYGEQSRAKGVASGVQDLVNRGQSDTVLFCVLFCVLIWSDLVMEINRAQEAIDFASGSGAVPERSLGLR